MPRAIATATITSASLFTRKDRRLLSSMGIDTRTIRVGARLVVNPAFPATKFVGASGKSRVSVTGLVNATMTARRAGRVSLGRDGHIAFLVHLVGRRAGDDLILHFNVKGTERGDPMLWLLKHGPTGRRTMRPGQQAGYDLYVHLPGASAVGDGGRVESLTLSMPAGGAFVFEGLRVIGFRPG